MKIMNATVQKMQKATLKAIVKEACELRDRNVAEHKQSINIIKAMDDAAAELGMTNWKEALQSSGVNSLEDISMILAPLFNGEIEETPKKTVLKYSKILCEKWGNSQIPLNVARDAVSMLYGFSSFPEFLEAAEASKSDRTAKPGYNSPDFTLRPDPALDGLINAWLKINPGWTRGQMSMAAIRKFVTEPQVLQHITEKSFPDC